MEKKINILELKNFEIDCEFKISCIQKEYISDAENFIKSQKEYYEANRILNFCNYRLSNDVLINTPNANYQNSYQNYINFSKFLKFDMKEEKFAVDNIFTNGKSIEHLIYNQLLSLDSKELDLKLKTEFISIYPFEKDLLESPFFTNYLTKSEVTDIFFMTYEKVVELIPEYSKVSKMNYYNCLEKNFLDRVYFIISVFYSNYKSDSTYENFCKVYNMYESFIQLFLNEERFINILNEYKLEVAKNVLSED